MEIDLLVLFWKLKCKERYWMTEEEFIKNHAYLGLDSFAKIKKAIPLFKRELEDPKQFKDFYVFCFYYMKDPDQKRIAIEYAIPTWKLILKGRYRYIDEWCTFIETEYKQSISLDTWKQFLEFIRDKDFHSFETFAYEDLACKYFII